MKKLFPLVIALALIPVWLPAQNRLPLANLRDGQRTALHTYATGNLPLTIRKSLLDNKKKLDNTYQEVYNNTTGQYDSNYREEYAYNEAGLCTQFICASYDTLAKSWTTTDEFTNVFSTSGQLLSVNIHSLDMKKNEWSTTKEEYEYNSSNQAIVLTTYQWNATTSLWVALTKEAMEYNPEGCLNKTTSYSHNDPATDWIPANKTETAYNTNNLKTESFTYAWDTTSQAWLNVSKDTVQYDSNGNQLQMVLYAWAATSSTWEPTNRNEIVYDANNDPVTQMDYTYNDNEWDTTARYVFFNNASFSRNDLLLPYFWADYPIFIHMLTSEIVYLPDPTTNQFSPGIRAIFNYSDFNMSVDPTVVSPLKVYPNPASELIVVESDQSASARFELFDVQGKIVLSEQLSGNRSQISTGTLPSGWYYYKITKDQVLGSGKVMIR